MPIPFCPFEPTEKQKLFLECETKEVLFGGAAGGGKSVALLMAALKYARQPGYAALIIRRDLPRLELAGGLIQRSHEWFRDTPARWIAGRRTWEFPIDGYRPATLTFGYLAAAKDKYRYASAEFQYIAFDELTDFEEEDYRFLFSRLRRSKGVDAKLRMRSASNPGGVGRLWVKQRFIDGAVGEHSRSRKFLKEGRCYIPARIEDNQHLNAEEYRESLAHLPPVEREQLLHGDWEVQADGIFKAEWLRYYVEVPGQVNLLDPHGAPRWCIPDGTSFRFVTIDPAGTSEDRARQARGKDSSWSVIQVWDRPRGEFSRFLVLREQVRGRFGLDELCHQIELVAELYEPERMWIENEKLGVGVVDLLKGRLPILETIATDNSEKIVRARELILKMSRGEVFLPKNENSWLADFEAELLAWTGDKKQRCDQIDAAAYAAIVARYNPSADIVILPFPRS